MGAELPILYSSLRSDECPSEAGGVRSYSREPSVMRVSLLPSGPA